MARNRDWDDDETDPLKGPKGDTAFLRSNHKLMAVGGVFRTPKAQFSPEKVHAENRHPSRQLLQRLRKIPGVCRPFEGYVRFQPAGVLDRFKVVGT